MAEYTEDVDELGFTLVDALTESEYTARLCAQITLSEEAEYSKEWNASDGLTLAATDDYQSVGFNATSGMTLAATPADTVSTNESATSGMALSDAAAIHRDTSVTDSVVVTAAAVFDVATMVTESIVVSAAAAPVRNVYASESDGLTLEEETTRVIEHNEVSTFNISHTIRVELDLDVVDIAQISAAASSLSAFVIATAGSDIALSAAAMQQLTAVENIVNTIKFADRPLIVDVTYPALWANSERMALALWQQTPYESFVMHKGELLAAGADGIYRFSSTATEAADVIASVVGDLSDYGSEKKKVFDAVTMAGTTGGPLRVRVETEMGSYWYETHLPSAAYPKTHRAPVGRGLTGRYVRYEIDNQATGHEGAAFSLSDVTARVGDSERVR
ncbi:MAG TPA: hypothetical protein PKV98_14635 [Burkholderiaceae bacterium]|nr:hypothetical protein [Burkholderiaceae bacterium]